MELTILMPCLNEERTLVQCIVKAKQFISLNGIAGEVVIADNGSSDNSVGLAKQHGARVIHVSERGYGAALRAGIRAAQGKYVVMGDADDSYDFLNLRDFVDQLRSGADLVMGNRFLGGIEENAMPWHHRHIGNPILSWLGRLFFDVKIRDFHCGLRAFRRDAIDGLVLSCSGMEFASEMVVRAQLAGLSIIEVPTTLKKDGRNRPPHLRSFRDGWRHLKFLLLHTPRWLFLYPGILLFIAGLATSVFIHAGSVHILNVVLDVHTMLYASALSFVGLQLVLFGVLGRSAATTMKTLPPSKLLEKFESMFSVEIGVAFGVALLSFSALFALSSLRQWSAVGYEDLDSRVVMRSVVPAVFLAMSAFEVIFASFLFGIMLTGRKD